MVLTVKFLLDEHVWGGLIKIGDNIEANIVLVQNKLPEGTEDPDVLQFAANEQRLLLTSNARDFAPIAAEWFLAGKEHWGILIVPGQTDRSLLSRAVTNIHSNYAADFFKNSYRFIQDFI